MRDDTPTSLLQEYGLDAMIADFAAFTDRMRLDGLHVRSITVTNETFREFRRLLREECWPKGELEPYETSIPLDLPTGVVLIRPERRTRAPKQQTFLRAKKCHQCGATLNYKLPRPGVCVLCGKPFANIYHRLDGGSPVCATCWKERKSDAE